MDPLSDEHQTIASADGTEADTEETTDHPNDPSASLQILTEQLTAKSQLVESVHQQLDNALSKNEEMEQEMDRLRQDAIRSAELLHVARARVNELEKQTSITSPTSPELEQVSGLDGSASSSVASSETKVAELEDKLGKFKALAVKLKKEVAESRQQFTASETDKSKLREQNKSLSKERDKIVGELERNLANFRSLQSEYDRIHDEMDAAQRSVKSAGVDLSSTMGELMKLKDEILDRKTEIDRLNAYIGQFNSEKASLEQKVRDLNGRIIVLESELSNERRKTDQFHSLEKQLMNTRRDLEAKLSELDNLTDRCDQLESHSHERDQLKKVIKTLTTERDSLGESVSRLADERRDLASQVERWTSACEEQKLQISQLTAAVQNSARDQGVMRDDLEKSLRTAEQLSADLKARVGSLEEELRARSKEFEAYKARVHKVVKKQQQDQSSKSSMSGQGDQICQQCDLNMMECRTLTARVATLTEQVNLQERDKQALDSEYRVLISKYDHLMDECKSKEETELKNKSLFTENVGLKSLIQDNQTRLNALDREKTQLSAEMSQLQEKLATLKDENDKLAKDLSIIKSQSIYGNHSQTSPRSEHQHTEFNSGLSSHHETMSVHSSNGINAFKSVRSNSPPLLNPLEEILADLSGDMTIGGGRRSNSGHRGGSESGVTPVNNDTQVKNERIISLLHEAEGNNLLLSEQNRVLKEEIRRLGRALERLEIAQNLEYLKNVTLKFLTLHSQDERKRLVPVLSTCLKLSPEEERELERMTAGGVGSSSGPATNPGITSPTSGWRFFR